MRRATFAIAPGPVSPAGSLIRRGRISAIGRDGELLVEDGNGMSSVVCDFLRTSSGALPSIREGDEVLYVRQADRERGCVLGVVQTYAMEQAPTHVKIEARERLELRCGTSSVTMTKDGGVLVKGEQLVSRASGVNKIRGAAVKIN